MSENDPEIAALRREVENLRLAVEARTVIGQAQGILMERFNVDADAAFAALRRLSRDSNRKLQDIAVELVATRVLPQPHGRGDPSA